MGILEPLSFEAQMKLCSAVVKSDVFRLLELAYRASYDLMKETPGFPSDETGTEEIKQKVLKVMEYTSHEFFDKMRGAQSSQEPLGANSGAEKSNPNWIPGNGEGDDF